MIIGEWVLLLIQSQRFLPTPSKSSQKLWLHKEGGGGGWSNRISSGNEHTRLLCPTIRLAAKNAGLSSSGQGESRWSVPFVPITGKNFNAGDVKSVCRERFVARTTSIKYVPPEDYTRSLRSLPPPPHSLSFLPAGSLPSPSPSGPARSPAY